MTNFIRAWIAIAALLAAAGCTAASASKDPTATVPAAPAEPAETRSPAPRFTTPPGLAGETPPSGAEQQFSTDFSLHSISYSEILSGGPPKDGIPAIDEPQFVSASEADEWLRPEEPVVLVEAGGEARAYPIQILVWHEIVNDTLGDQPVAVTFCPLCNTAIVFDRRVGSEVLDFGTTGRLRFSNLIMYDRQTETWWQQASGEAIAGLQTGTRLNFLPGQTVAWEEFKSAYPDSLVLSRQTGFVRSYGDNPYAGYDDINSSPFLLLGEADERLPAMTRVLTIERNGDFAAYRYDQLADHRVANDVVGGVPVVVFWAPGTESAFKESAFTDTYADVGAAISYSAVVEGQTLTFKPDEEIFIDEQTGSLWNILGKAVSGPLAGTQLAEVVGINHFWFSWAAFRPETRVFEFSD